jgi:Flp pilus assembly protein TadG
MKRLAHDQRGQVFAITAVAMFALVLMAGFVIDVGAAIRQHRHAQRAADASALAAAQMLPTSTSQATLASTQVAAQNFTDGTMNQWSKLPAGCSADPCYKTTYVANDTVSVQADTSSGAFFTKIFHPSGFPITATATARVGSYTGWSTNIAPWVTDKDSLLWGQTATFKVKPGQQASSGNFGGAQLPVNENGCKLSNGGSDYRSLIGDSSHSCLVQVGNQLLPETGNLTGPTGQGLSDRGTITPFNPYNILKQLPDGDYVLTTYSHPNLVVIPVIDSFHPGNSSPFNVIGFAWFIITSYTNNSVTGMFIGSEVPSGAQCIGSGGGQVDCPVGGYSDLGFKVIELVN